MNTIPTIGSLCSGYGGLEMGVELAIGPVRHAWHGEVDPDASAVLAANWPGVPNLGDITAVDWSAVEPVDILVAGYPCQGESNAGLRRGADDPRHRWPEPGRTGQPRLSPRFVEWLMGLDEGHVTKHVPEVDPKGVRRPARVRTNALRILGNGGVPQQMAHGVRELLGRMP